MDEAGIDGWAISSERDTNAASLLASGPTSVRLSGKFYPARSAEPAERGDPAQSEQRRGLAGSSPCRAISPLCEVCVALCARPG